MSEWMTGMCFGLQISSPAMRCMVVFCPALAAMLATFDPHAGFDCWRDRSSSAKKL
jgi:hypothetical protein